MSFLYPYLLTTHILFGSIGLLSGSYNLLRKKGGSIHVKVGKLFVVSMLITGSTALSMALLKPNMFLFIVGVFTVFLVGTGQRYMHLKKLGEGQKPKLIDWILSCSMLLVGVVFVSWGNDPAPKKTRQYGNSISCLWSHWIAECKKRLTKLPRKNQIQNVLAPGTYYSNYGCLDRFFYHFYRSESKSFSKLDS